MYKFNGKQMIKEDIQKRLEILAEKVIDDTLSDEETKELQDLVTGDENNALFYTELMQQHAMLSIDAEHLPSASEFSHDESKPRPISWVIAVAALLAVCFMLFNKPVEKEDQYFAILESTDFAQWGDCTLPTASGEKLRAGKLRLHEGLATIKFTSGATVTLEGPAEFEILDNMNTRLLSGILVSDVPESAHGFTVHTPTAKAVDHGTRFLTQVKNNGETTVLDVLEGEVEIIHEKSTAREMVKTGEMVKSSSSGLENFTELKEEMHFKEIDSKSLSSNVIRITTNYGKGKDGIATNLDPEFHFDSTMVMIKNSESHLRKGLIGFDLSFIEKNEIDSVELDMNLVFSGYGVVALSKDSQFSIYGLLDDSEDYWNQGYNPIEDCPAYAQGTAEINLAKAVKVGSFSLPRGKVTGKVSVSSQELQNFIKNDKNNFATLIIICESSFEGKTGSLIYAVAGKYHPTTQAPALNITLKNN